MIMMHRMDMAKCFLTTCVCRLATSSAGRRGFAIAQGRFGTGSIHHCMRCIGAAEKSLELAIDRGLSRSAFGKPLLDLGGNRERIADARVKIDQARLLTLYAAYKMDKPAPKRR